MDIDLTVRGEAACTPESPPNEMPTTTESPSGVAEGAYAFADVQVLEDGIGDFEVRARATNNGSDKAFVSLTATIFNRGSVVGAASAFESDWQGGDTRTVTFITTDDYSAWDEIEFQVDGEF